MAQEANPEGGQAPNSDPSQTPDPGPPPEGTPPPEAPEGRTYDEATVSALRQEAAGYRTRLRDAESKLQEREDADASDLEKANKRADREKTRADDAEAKLLRYEVAKEKQVPADAIDLLTATDREGLEAQADRLVALAKQGEKPPNFDGGPRDPAPEPKSPEEAHAELVTGLFGGGQIGSS